VLEDRIELSTIQVNTLADNPNGPMPGSTTLRDAINRADAGADTQYTIDLTELSGTITLGSALPNLGNTNGGVSGKEIDIEAPGATKLTVGRSTDPGTPDFRIFTIGAGANVTIDGLTIAWGRAVSGGGIYNSGGTLAIDDCSISDNTDSGYGNHSGGGGIYSTGTLNIIGSTINRNHAATDGGGIFNLGSLDITDSSISDNQLSDPFRSTSGGGISNQGGQAKVVSCTIVGNAATYGGGIRDGASYSNSGTLIVTSSVIKGNTAEYTGGGIGIGYDGSGSESASLSYCTIENNTAEGFEGGGISNANTLMVNSCTIDGNSAERGGGISSGGTLTVTGSTINSNQAYGRGSGGLYNIGTVTIANSTIAFNSASNYGGVRNDGTLKAINDTIADNTDSAGGGGLDTAGTATLNNTLIALNLRGTTASDISGAVSSSSAHNLIGIGGSGGLTNSNGNQVGVANPGLDPNGLQNNGGPTWTMALVPGSPAINAGSNDLVIDPQGNPLQFDQRGAGFVRIFNGTVDIGAYEIQTGKVVGFVIPPTAVGLQCVAVPLHSTGLMVSFSQPMDAARAENPANYRVVWAGRDHRLGTADDRVIPIRSARYDAASWSIKLRFKRLQPLHRTLWLTVNGASQGGLTNASGTPLAGAGTAGQVGAQAIRLNLPALQRPTRLGLLPDGGFEALKFEPEKQARTLSVGDPSLSAWRVSSGSVDVQTYWPAAEGTHSLDLNGVSAGTIEQSFATVPGQIYQLLFDYANNPDNRRMTAVARMTVTGLGTLLSRDISHTGSTPREMKYTRFFGTFVANSATTTLRFVSTTPGAYGIVLDAVSVTAVPGAADTSPA
jgi:choice-of-anchor C domain-containing protein